MSEPIAWGKVSIKMAKTGVGDAMGTPLVDVGLIKDNTAHVEPQDGTTLEMYATGHELVEAQDTEGHDQVVFDVIGIDLSVIAAFFGKTIAAGVFGKTTTVISDRYSIEITPTVVGATGYRAPKCSVSIKSGYTDAEGWLHNFTVKVLKPAAGNTMEYFDTAVA